MRCEEGSAQRSAVSDPLEAFVRARLEAAEADADARIREWERRGYRLYSDVATQSTHLVRIDGERGSA